jgi:hypothetical protein
MGIFVHFSAIFVTWPAPRLPNPPTAASKARNVQSPATPSTPRATQLVVEVHPVGERAGELDNPVGPEAAQLGRHGQHDPRPSHPEHIIGCGDRAEEIGRDLADLVASLCVIASGCVHDVVVAKAKAFAQPLAEIELERACSDDGDAHNPASSSRRATLNRATLRP